MNNNFVQTINNKKIVKVVFDSNEKGIITRNCIPFDFGPSRRYRDGKDRYHFYDLDSPPGNYNLSILPSQILSIDIMEEGFDPAQCVTWTPIKWLLARDWGLYS
ncbi:hypothetical protein CQ395_17020 [Clostridium neonatale]|uniref:Uncharacterized protein n=1 Tax=Clostridium neonatale TaxID=137838 RepID=A0A2A7MEE0_9CLOT|nr:hypothetical protein [Clostridium neonatale]MBS4804184.1 hypothetical protein [Clostridium sp.]MBS5950478.1 hypothetical protein [Clostridium sp.]PEG25666.1 hypothetical protein CQ395_17020 [Clostridium neonatale]PEG29478.1 hypothetical protein CQ394_16070 [Clostridium neonatale]CAH0435218.1 Conserved hypothetical protein [Clostridium neonatale]